jgi:hypothetical protein
LFAARDKASRSLTCALNAAITTVTAKIYGSTSRIMITVTTTNVATETRKRVTCYVEPVTSKGEPNASE